MSPLRKSRMVEGQHRKTHHLIADFSIFTRQCGRFCCVTYDAFYDHSVLPIAARVTE
ncbi:hypothetical protein FBBNIHIM_01975 [Pseudocitrobacter vendiensis]|uniref:Transposase n=1 Tax=Pseudocitrobacter vendiensis TaxID=2488306 RepID=A0ABM9F4A9_9ENTR|nr:hypothetical protein FBBNIHIM_01975 [Pseudocitrobacter vendiensis]